MKIKTGWGWLLMILMSVGMEAQTASAEICGTCDIVSPRSEYEDPLAVVCITNETNDRLIYNYRWGQRPWKDNQSEPDETWWYSLSLNAEAVARDNYSPPTFWLKFDRDMTDGAQFITIDLETYVVGESVFKEKGCDVSKRYKFRYGQSSRWLQLEETI